MHFVKKKVKGKTYLSIGETHWVDGRAKTTLLKYLGSAEKVYQIFLGLDKEETEYHRRYLFAAPLAYERTILPFILRIPPEKLTSQAFWDHMEYLNEEEIERIEKELSSRIIELYDLNTECLLYDLTNFYTFIQEHEGNKLPKM